MARYQVYAFEGRFLEVRGQRFEFEWPLWQEIGSRISDSFGYLQRSLQGFVGLAQRLYIVCGNSKEEVRFDVMLRNQSRANHRGVI